MEYPIRLVADGIYEINEFDGVSMFLIVGEKRALLVDTGVGIGNIAEFIKTLTDLPADVFITHNHRDHAGGAANFGRVYISAVDKKIGPMVRPWTSAQSRRRFAQRTVDSHPDRSYPWTMEDIAEYSGSDEPQVIGVEDGFTFDLGGRTAKCVLCPGHTPGSMAVIDSKTGALLAGDCCNTTFGIGVRPLENPDCGLRHSTVEEAAAALKRLWEMDFNKELVFNAHTDYRSFGKPLAPWVLPGLMTAMERLVRGELSVHSERIDVIDTDVDFAEYEGIRLQFHTDNIKTQTEDREEKRV